MKRKTYYTCCILKSGRTVISTSKLYIAELLGISEKTIQRHLINTFVYKTEDFIICKDVVIHKIKRGFACR